MDAETTRDKSMRETLAELQAAGMPAAEIAKWTELHLGAGRTAPADSPFKKRSDRPGIINLPTGRFQARILGEVVPLKLHWLESGASFPCVPGCRYCPSLVSLYGYWPVLAYRWVTRDAGYSRDPDKAELLPTILSLWETASAELVSMHVCRGNLVEFHRRNGKDQTPRIDVLEDRAGYVLPECFDVRHVLMRRWGLERWPDQGFGREEKKGRKKA